MFENSEPGTLGAELNDLSLDQAKLILQETMIECYGPMSKWKPLYLKLYEEMCAELDAKKINRCPS